MSPSAKGDERPRHGTAKGGGGERLGDSQRVALAAVLAVDLHLRRSRGGAKGKWKIGGNAAGSECAGADGGQAILVAWRQIGQESSALSTERQELRKRARHGTQTESAGYAQTPAGTGGITAQAEGRLASCEDLARLRERCGSPDRISSRKLGERGGGLGSCK